MKKTALFHQHTQLNAKIVDFSGWAMPTQYTSQIAEHNAVRSTAGLFDVSHMTVVDIQGKDASAFLRHLLANDIQKLKTDGQALYSCMLNENGGVIDDLIIYRLDTNNFRCVINAACCDKDIAWIQQQAAHFSVTIIQPNDYCIFALQGPDARSLASQLLPQALSQTVNELKPFHACAAEGTLIARTGYTGEDGLELILPSDLAIEFWQLAIKAGVTPCGLAARDTLRIEAGLNLYGQDMTQDTSPLISNLAWTVSFHDTARHFIGRTALTQQQEQGISEKLVGISMTERGVLRSGQVIHFNNGTEGTITSGSFSPTLNHAIGFARVPVDAPNHGSVIVRKKTTPIQITKLPFVRQGKPCQQLHPIILG